MTRIAPDDIRLWRQAMRDVAPLRDRPSAPDRSECRHIVGNAATAGKTPAVQRKQAAPPPAPASPLDRFAGVDRATADKVRRGRYPVEARLDLHGMTQDEAHRALSGFVVGARAAERRCVLVITGHGRSSGGVLRQAVPRWLAEPELRRHLLAISPARPQHGGHGALYLLLRRTRELP